MRGGDSGGRKRGRRRNVEKSGANTIKHETGRTIWTKRRRIEVRRKVTIIIIDMGKDRRKSIPEFNAKSGRRKRGCQVSNGRIVGGGGLAAGRKIAATERGQTIRRG